MIVNTTEIQMRISPTTKKIGSNVAVFMKLSPTSGSSSTICIAITAIIAIICETVFALPHILAATTLPFEAAISRIEVTENSRKSTIMTATQSHIPSCTKHRNAARVVKVNGVRSETLDQIHVSDPVALALCNLEHKIFELQKQLDELKKENVKSEE
jgi:DNA-directed RNA polymerase subunit H (RpoH/RPB5)